MAEETKLKSQMSDGEAVKFSDDELQSLQGVTKYLAKYFNSIWSIKS